MHACERDDAACEQRRYGSIKPISSSSLLSISVRPACSWLRASRLCVPDHEIALRNRCAVPRPSIDISHFGGALHCIFRGRTSQSCGASVSCVARVVRGGIHNPFLISTHRKAYFFGAIVSNAKKHTLSTSASPVVHRSPSDHFDCALLCMFRGRASRCGA